MPRKDPDLLKVANSSGYLLQLRLAREIEGIQSAHGWRVVASEHHWLHPRSGESGYIDLIAGYGIVRLVVECKRPQGATWVFVAPRGAPGTAVARCFWTDRWIGGPPLSGWDELHVEPSSTQSSFCIVRGQTDKDQPMLERTADALLESVEALGHEELEIRSRLTERRIYLPLVVTTAQLEVCHCDIDEVDLITGTLPDADFETVHWVRFRKGLGSPISSTNARDLQEANREKERTILVVQATHLAEFLREMKIRPPIGEEWPHQVARALAQRQSSEE